MNVLTFRSSPDTPDGPTLDLDVALPERGDVVIDAEALRKLLANAQRRVGGNPELTVYGWFSPLAVKAPDCYRCNDKGWELDDNENHQPCTNPWCEAGKKVVDDG